MTRGIAFPVGEARETVAPHGRGARAYRDVFTACLPSFPDRERDAALQLC